MDDSCIHVGGGAFSVYVQKTLKTSQKKLLWLNNLQPFFNQQSMFYKRKLKCTKKCLSVHVVSLYFINF